MWCLKRWPQTTEHQPAQSHVSPDSAFSQLSVFGVGISHDSSHQELCA